MANPRIDVEIGAKVQGLQSGVNQAENQINRLANASNQASPKVNKLSQSISGANGVGIEFSRIIQDAPFGIIGVGNNITQLAGSFSNLQRQTGSATQALKIGLQSIISPANLLVLGISAVTTALTLYAQSASKAKSPVNELKEAQDAFNESLKETDRLLGEDFLNKLLKDVGLVETQEIGGRLIDVRTFENATQVVDALSGSINKLRKGELELLAKFLKTEVAEANRDLAQTNNDIIKSLATKDLELYQGLLDEINEELEFYKESGKEVVKTSGLVLASFTDARWQEAIDNQTRLNQAFNQLKGTEGQVNSDPFGIENLLGGDAPITEVADVFTEQLEKVRLKVDDLQGAFTGLGSLIGSAFNNTGLGQFVGQFLGFASKLIATNFKIATSSAIAGASNSALASGPGAVFTLPAFIAGAVGLVASAFSAIGSGASRGGSSGVGSGVSGTSFNGQGVTGFASNREIFGELVVRGNDLVYVFDESRNKIAKG